MSCWVVSDGVAGNEKQCLALAHYLTVDANVFQLKWRQPWDMFAPNLVAGAQFGLTKPSYNSWRKQGFPKLAIGAGKRGALGLRLIKEKSPSTYTVQILNPRVESHHFDLLIAPRHDGLSEDNLIATTGALHNVDEKTLNSAHDMFGDSLGKLPGPRVALLIGASNRAAQIDEAYLDQLLLPIREFVNKNNGSLMVTASRRTSDKIKTFLEQKLQQINNVYIWRGQHQGPNPYMGYLAYADKIVVTPDSVNMISEALGTGKSVYSTPPFHQHGRLVSFHNYLHTHKMLSDVSKIDTDLNYKPLREAADIADFLQKKL